MEQEPIRMMQYLDGELSGTEMKQVQEEITRDESARKDLELLRDIDRFLAAKDRLAFRDLLAQARVEYHNQSRREKLRKIFWASAAATILLLASLYIWQSFYSGKKSGEALYAMYYRTYPSAQVTRSASPGDQSLHDAYRAYEQRDFDAAYNLFLMEAEKNPDSITPRFYMGICALETNRVHKAISLFREVSQSRTSPYRSHAQWFLALSLIRSGETRKSVRQLEEIVAEDNMYSLLAEELLLSLN
ncbi:MAG: hypothetical protein U0T82_13250 [Bacteroidales bacterium]